MTRMPEPIDYDIAIPSDAAGIVRLLATAFSESEFRKLGFADRLSVSYADFRFQDEPVFNAIQGHERAILMDKTMETK
jgi:hypothetical protein